MSVIREDSIYIAINKAYALTDYNIHNNIHKQYEFWKQTILADESLTKYEKSKAIRMLTEPYDKGKLIYNRGTRRVCENCNQKCLATLYCEYCVRNNLINNFSNWTSGNDDIDNLIQESFHIDDFDKLNNQKNSSKINSIFKVKNYPKYSKGIQKMANDEIHNNPNLHSEEQDELELLDSKDSLF
ncbi:hypothetical protein RhiirA4_481503 [Rhizophagus irregularis]|uniref:Uncharacterized protein n=1 Tax=Rhizophagus irregularis TaxID=588596 RepID=A0A2I1HJM3_9GLOM|nr:hypothetical protein RhiirA4_481503 [Rhizophagus irregularis]